MGSGYLRGSCKVPSCCKPSSPMISNITQSREYHILPLASSQQHANFFRHRKKKKAVQSPLPGCTCKDITGITEKPRFCSCHVHLSGILGVGRGQVHEKDTATPMTK